MPNASINPAVKALSPPPIPLVQQWGNSYDGSLGPLLDLSQAVPGYPPHSAILNWLAEAAADASLAGYGNIEGESALRSAYASHVSDLYNASLVPANVHITAGCNQAFISTMMAIAGAGDTALLSNPFYFNHESTLDMLGIKTRLYETDPHTGFLPSLPSIQENLDDSVKAIVLISPNNPTGAVYPTDLLMRIYRLCQEKGLWLILDETYRDFLPTGREKPHALLNEKGWGANFIQLYSFSKSFCIPGHRLGAVLAAPEVVQEIAKVMDNLQICAPRIPQMAVAKALPALTDWRQANRAEIAARATVLKEVMTQCPDWPIKAMGAYFAYIKHPFHAKSSTDVAKILATQCGVTCIPGEFFGTGQEQYLRVAFANADQQQLKLLSDRLIECQATIE
ncbi:MAG: aminotransferase [Sneathiella sp.]